MKNIYDRSGNVTADPQGSMTLAWNVLDMPRTLTSGSASTQRAYLSDGTLAQVSDGTTTRLYVGDMVFTRTGTSGTPVLESAAWEGGRLINGSGTGNLLYYVTDHLGSVRVVKDGAGTVRQRFDYYPYGSVSRVYTNSSTTDNSIKRYRFGGKEIAGTSLTDLAGTGAAPGAPYLDFGARLYSPGTASWLSVDPMAEKYYPIGLSVYCLGSPISLKDPFGLSSYLSNGDWTTIDDGDDNFRMEVSERQLAKLKAKFEKGVFEYGRYREKLSIRNGYTFSGVEHTKQDDSDIAGAVLTVQRSKGEGYMERQANDFFAGEALSLLSALTSKRTTERINVGTNGEWYLKSSKGFFRGNQYVSVENMYKTLKGASFAVDAVNFASTVAYANYVANNMDPVSARLYMSTAVSGAVGGFLLSNAGASLGVLAGAYLGPETAIVGSIVGGMAGNDIGQYVIENVVSGKWF